MPLAIELAAARVEALGVAQLADRLDDRFALLTGGDRLAPGRHRSLAAAVEWSYRLLGEEERRVFRLVSVFPGPFTLEAAEAVAGPGAGAVVLRLVDCSLLVPPREGPDGRWRYAMLQTLRGLRRRAAGRVRGAGCGRGCAGPVGGGGGRAGRARGCGPSRGRRPRPGGWMPRTPPLAQVLAWAMEHDADLVLRLVAGLGWWWYLRARLAGQYPLLREAAGRGVPGSDGWCAAQFFAGYAAWFSGDTAASLGHATALRDAAAKRGPCPALADGLAGRAAALANMGRHAEAADEARRALAVAREIAYPLGQVLALGGLAFAAQYAGDPDGAVRLARQAGQITAGIPGSIARWCGYILTYALIEAGDLAAAETACAAALAQARDMDDLQHQAILLSRVVILDLEAGRLQDAAAHLREAIQVDTRTGQMGRVHQCPGLLRAAVRGDRAVPPRPSRCGPRTPRSRGTKRPRTRPMRYAAGRGRCAGPGRRSVPAGPGRPNSAARR